MAGLVLNWTFGFQKKFSTKLKVSAPKSATSPSCETLCAMPWEPLPTDEKKKKMKNIFAIKIIRLILSKQKMSNDNIWRNN